MPILQEDQYIIGYATLDPDLSDLPANSWQDNVHVHGSCCSHHHHHIIIQVVVVVIIVVVIVVIVIAV